MVPLRGVTSRTPPWLDSTSGCTQADADAGDVVVAGAPDVTGAGPDSGRVGRSSW